MAVGGHSTGTRTGGALATDSGRCRLRGGCGHTLGQYLISLDSV